MTNGGNPCLRGSGGSRRSTSAGDRSTALANGNSFSPHSGSDPNAEGSVHIPYSDQNPGSSNDRGNVRMACRLASMKTPLSVR